MFGIYLTLNLGLTFTVSYSKFTVIIITVQQHLLATIATTVCTVNVKLGQVKTKPNCRHSI